MPIHISTTRATTTTRAEIINPCIIGLAPDFFILLNEVLSPIAARAHTIKNLLVSLVKETTSVGKAKVKTVGIIESVLVNLTIVAKSPAPSEKAYPVATTDEVSFTAVPAEIRLDIFQLSFSALPIKYPPPKQVSKVKSITTRDIFPTFKITLILRESPSRMIANLRSFFEVNLNPGVKCAFLCKKELIIIPINIAITDAPITWIGKRLSKKQANTAISTDKSVPGRILVTDKQILFSLVF